MTLPLAHVGHYLWVFYLLPVAIVVGAIVRHAIRQRSSGDEGDDAD